MGKFKNRTGERYGKLIAISPIRKNNRIHWNCICDCGVKTIVNSSALGCGNTKTCGICNIKSRAKKNGKNFKIHGDSHTPLHNCWSSMIRKTSYQESYKNIIVCNDWKQYINFKEWALKNGFKKGLTIERINNDNGYNPNNCKFATRAEQSRNRTTTKLNWNKVNIIRKMCDEGITHKKIAALFNITRQTVSDINVNRRWKK